MGTVIVVTSGKGGTGKTTCTGAIASALALLGHRTLCVDCDIGLRNLDLVLGMSEQSVWDLSDIISEGADIHGAVLAHSQIPELYFLPAPAEKSPEDIDSEAFSRLKDSLREEFEYVLIDSPAGLGRGFKLASQGADMAVVVATADIPSLRDGQKTVARLEGLQIPEIRLLINRVSPHALKNSGLTLDDAIDMVGARLLGLVSEDDSVPLAANLEKPLMVMGAKHAYGQFMRIARRVTGERLPLARRLRAD